MKSLTVFTMALCCAIISLAQGSQTFVINDNGIDENRYEGIERSPYMFDSFASAKVTNLKKNETITYNINYNGYTGEFEFQHEGKTIVLEDSYYDIIEIESFEPSQDLSSKYVSDKSIKFVKGLDPKNSGQFQIDVFSNKELKVFKTFSARLAKKEAMAGSSTGPIETFVPNVTYHILKDGKSRAIGLNKKKILETLNNPQVESFVKKNKFKMKSENELKRVLAYYHDMTVTEKPDSEVVASSN